MSGKTNVQLLAGSQAFNQRAKKARREQVDSIKFDDEARREWLTGFSKRKKAKTEERKVRAKERDHAQHLEDRRKARQDLKERALQNVKSVRAAMGLPETIEDEPEAGPSTPREEMAEFSDEEQLATVTITEDFDPSASTSLPSTAKSVPQPKANDTEGSAKKGVAAPLMPASSARAQGKAKREADKLKAKKSLEKERSRSMETKAERRKGKEMEARRRSKKAGIAMEKYGSSGDRKKKAGVKLKRKFR